MSNLNEDAKPLEKDLNFRATHQVSQRAFDDALTYRLSVLENVISNQHDLHSSDVRDV